MKDLFDEYSLKARLIPTFLILLPAALAAWTWTENVKFDWRLLGGIAAYCGVTFLLSQLGRDLGRQKQEKLFILWGGKPTTRLLRYRTKAIDAITLNRYHMKLEKMMGQKFPTKEEESANKKAADVVYESAGKMLLEKTRDKEKYALLFKENINYGFRRNLWAMKPAGIFICCISLIASIIPVCGAVLNPTPVPMMAMLSGVCAIVFLTLWILRITPNWVHMTADAYALRLLASCEQLWSKKG